MSISLTVALTVASMGVGGVAARLAITGGARLGQAISSTRMGSTLSGGRFAKLASTVNNVGVGGIGFYE